MYLSDAINQFAEWRQLKVSGKTNQQYKNELRRFCVYLRNDHLEHVTFNQITSYISLLQAIGYQHNTFVPICMALKKFFEYWSRKVPLPFDPYDIPIPKKEYKIPRVIDSSSYQKLLDVIPKETNDPRHIRNLAIVMLLWDTGARNGEVCSLNLSEVDLENQRATIRTEKSRGRRPLRELFWSDETNEALQRWITKRKTLADKRTFQEPDALFISIAGGLAGQRLKVSGLSEALRRYSNKAGLSYANAHSFRHHKAHMILRNGGSAADVQNILGHASLASSSIYSMMFGNELEERARRFMEKELQKIDIGSKICYNYAVPDEKRTKPNHSRAPKKGLFLRKNRSDFRYRSYHGSQGLLSRPRKNCG